MKSFDSESVEIITMIEGLKPHEVPEFVRRSVETRRLTRIVTTLNRDALSRDHARRAAAEKALRHIGFI